MSQPAGEKPQSFGHYDVESVLGRGAMGMVYLARDRRIGRRVALKTVHVNEKFEDESDAREYYKRLQREAELCGALQHPNIVTLYEPGYENDVIAWMATEYVDGENLRDRLRRRKPLPLDEALHITEDVLRGLAYAHAKGIVHRDIKPANILLTSGGEAKIADFGIARPQDSNLTAVGEMLGTPSYMSPEQVKTSPVTTRSDLFSLGAVLYEMVTGVKAYAGGDVTGILRKVVEGTPAPPHEVNADVPESLSRFFYKLSEKKPEDRYATAVDALEDLQAIQREVAANRPAGPVESEEIPAAISTMAMPAAAASTHPSGGATEPDFDATPAVSTRDITTTGLRRTVPSSLFWGVIVALGLLLGGFAWGVRMQMHAAPQVSYSPSQLRAFEEKKRALRKARALFLEGKMQESLAAYDSYIARYPQSEVARVEREDVRAAVERASETKAKVTVTARRPAREPEGEKQPERRNWLQRLLHRGEKKP